MEAALEEYVPVPHNTHAAEPGEALKYPAPHGEQGPPSGPVYPALQRQALRATLPVPVVVLLAGQVEHATLSVVVLYVPAAHAAQGSPVYPALHPVLTHALLEVLPARDVVPAGQFKHAAEPVVSL